MVAPIAGQWYRSWVNSLNPLYQKAGLRVEPDRTNWGIKGVSCILKAGKECVPPAKVFWDMVLSLEKAGYRAGTSLFGVPYDWRLPPTRNKLCADLARILFHITNTTAHRKAIVAAHSLGNLQLLHCFHSVFGPETLGRIKGLVAIAAPWAGAPQGLRVLFSGAEMVSRLIISDAETRDFARQMPGAYMLLPNEQVWANHSILQLAADDDSSLPTSYRGRRGEMSALFAKMEAYDGVSASGMGAAYRAALEVVDVWRPPTLPVVCVIGSGKPTHVSFGYCEAWPRNMGEEPCTLRFEDGDTTVPVRSAESVCAAWKEAKACHAPLSTLSPSAFRHRSLECVDIVHLHCRGPAMESLETPRPGPEHCAEYHSKILHKRPTIELVQNVAHNPHAFEPGYTPLIAQAHELSELFAWLSNSAVRRLPSPSELGAALARWRESAPALSDPPPGAPDLEALQAAWTATKGLAAYERALASLRALSAAAAAVGSSSRAAASSAAAEGGAAAAQLQQQQALRAAAAKPLAAVEATVGPISSAVRVASAALADADALCADAREGGGAAAASHTAAAPSGGRGLFGTGPWGAKAKGAADEAGGDEAEGDEANWLVEAASLGASGLGCEGGAHMDAWERAQHCWYEATPEGGAPEQRTAAAREASGAWACSLHEALADFAKPLADVRSQLQWCSLHLSRLAETLRRPPEAPPEGGASPQQEAPFESALYGRMEDDSDLRSD